MLEIVAGLELSVHHVIVFHVHERSIRIRLGVAVPLPAGMQLCLVLFQLVETGL